MASTSTLRAYDQPPSSGPAARPTTFSPLNVVDRPHRDTISPLNVVTGFHRNVETSPVPLPWKDVRRPLGESSRRFQTQRPTTGDTGDDAPRHRDFSRPWSAAIRAMSAGVPL